MLQFWSFLYSKCFNPEGRPAGDRVIAEERRVALNVILRAVQKQSFSKVLSVIPEHPQYDEKRTTITKNILKHCKELKGLQRLSPFICHGLLGVGGGLRNSSLLFDAKYTIFLPHSHPVTDLLIVRHHKKEGHMGVNHVMADINHQYLIINGRSAVKKVINKHVVCHFWNINAKRQQMGDLPCDQVEKRQPFEVVGTDLMGPIAVSFGRSRVKYYTCILNCLAMRTVHLEVVP